MKKQKRIGPAPLAHWLLDYVDAHDIDLTDLAELAGLSAASLYTLLNDPERVPTLETCLRLSMATGKSVEEMFRMAGQDGYKSVENLDPDRLELLRSYQELPRHMRHILCMIAQMLERSGTRPIRNAHSLSLMPPCGPNEAKHDRRYKHHSLSAY